MTEEVVIRGRCVCGTVTIEAQALGREIGVCHCALCRQWAGGPFMAIECHELVDLRGTSAVTTFPSSEWAHRAFCNQCGSSLYFRMNDGSFLAVAAGLFDLGHDWQLTDELFMENKPCYYGFAGSTRQWIGDGVERADS